LQKNSLVLYLAFTISHGILTLIVSLDILLKKEKKKKVKILALHNKLLKSDLYFLCLPQRLLCSKGFSRKQEKLTPSSHSSSLPSSLHSFQ